MGQDRKAAALVLALALVVIGPSAVLARGHASPRPKILAYEYVPGSASPGQAAFEVDAVDPDGQVVGLRLSGDITLIADGGCGLGDRANGDPAHFHVPVRALADGDHTLTITVSSSTCNRAPRVEQTSQTVTLRLPSETGTDAHPRCDTPTTKRLVRRFAHAFARGDLHGADQSFAREPAFRWYSTSAPGARLRGASSNRRTLRAYFRRRIEKHEQLRLRQLKASYEARRDLANFHGSLVRSADDLRAASYGFKGAATCARGRARIIVWSMSDHA